jgi:hypothetical protein
MPSCSDGLDIDIVALSCSIDGLDTDIEALSQSGRPISGDFVLAAFDIMLKVANAGFHQVLPVHHSEARLKVGCMLCNQGHTEKDFC